MSNKQKGLVEKLVSAKGNNSAFRKEANIIASFLTRQYQESFNGKPAETLAVVIMRAGEALLPAFQKRFSGLKIGRIYAKREEKTLNCRVQKVDLPKVSVKRVIILDPMLASGGTIDASIKLLRDKYQVGPQNIVVIAVFSTKKGEERVKRKHRGVKILSLLKDLELDKKGFILIPQNQSGFATFDFGDEYCGR